MRRFMAHPGELPWFGEAVGTLDLRRRERVLMITVAEPDHAAAVADVVGREGYVLALEPDPVIAKACAELDRDPIEVIALEPTGAERIGTFDAVFSCPLAMPLWPLTLWADMTLHNLRPGGRFVVDLPAERMSEDLAAAWSAIGGADEALHPIAGVSERDLAAALRARGLRQVQASMGTHLLRGETTANLAEFARRLLHIDRDRTEELHIELTRRLRTSGPAELVLHRTRVHGIR